MKRSKSSPLAALPAIALPLLALLGCDRGSTASAQTDAGASPADGAPSAMVKLSKYGMAQYCSIATGPDGTIHALFTDSTAIGKPHYVWYRASTDGGTTWSDAKNLSDDESGLGAGWCQVKVDGSGRPYAIWKYIDESTALDGPGGRSGGVLAYRCLDGGSWTKARRFGDKHQPVVAWFAADGPDHKVNLLYTQVQPDVDLDGRGSPPPQMADNLTQLVLDGGNGPQSTPIFTAKPLPTKAEIEAAHVAGKDLTYEQQNVRYDGLWNLRGYIAADGRPHFIGETYKATSQDPQRIVRYDGQSLAKFYDYKGYLGYNTFNHPPALVRAADGKEHFVRKPEKAASELIRDYPVENGEPADPTDVIANDSDRTKIFDWDVTGLADGRIAAMAALSPKGMYDDACDLYVAIGDGRGKWTKPINVTDNDARAKFFAKAAVSQSSSYRPVFAEAATLKDGSVGIACVNVEHTISGLNTVAITGSGRAVEGMSSVSNDSPFVFFTKVKG